MKKLDQSGFASIEAVLVLVVLAVIIGAGFLVFQSRQSGTTRTTLTSSTQSTKQAAVKDSSFDVTIDSYYDCADAMSNGNAYGGGIDQSTGDCRYNNTGGQVYKLPTTYSDDMIRGVKGFQFTSSEVTEVRSIAQAQFQACKGYASIQIYSEADGKYFEIGISCGDGYRQMMYLDGGKWTKIDGGQDGISCDTITKYRVPANVLIAGGYSDCHTEVSTKNIKSLSGYEGYGQ